MTVGEALKQLRSQLGLTQEQMAGGIISESYYSKVERNLHIIDAKSLIMILRVHDIDMSSFLIYYDIKIFRIKIKNMI